MPVSQKITQNTWLDYWVWVTDNSDPGNFTTIEGKIPIVPIDLPSQNNGDLDISIFAAKGYTFQDTTHLHLVINVYPPFFSPALSAHVNYDDTFWHDSGAPQQFEHTFDLIGGKFYSRFNLSWMVNNRTISSVAYSVTCSYPSFTAVSTDPKKIVVEHF